MCEINFEGPAYANTPGKVYFRLKSTVPCPNCGFGHIIDVEITFQGLSLWKGWWCPDCGEYRGGKNEPRVFDFTESTPPKP